MKYEVLSARLEPAVLGWDQNCFVFVKNESGDIDQLVVSRHGEILDAGDIEAIPKDLQQAVKASAREAFESEPNQLATIENLLVSTVISSQCNNCMAYQAKYKRKTATAK